MNELAVLLVGVMAGYVLNAACDAAEASQREKLRRIVSSSMLRKWAAESRPPKELADLPEDESGW